MVALQALGRPLHESQLRGHSGGSALISFTVAWVTCASAAAAASTDSCGPAGVRGFRLSTVLQAAAFLRLAPGKHCGGCHSMQLCLAAAAGGQSAKRISGVSARYYWAASSDQQQCCRRIRCYQQGCQWLQGAHCSAAAMFWSTILGSGWKGLLLRSRLCTVAEVCALCSLARFCESVC